MYNNTQGKKTNNNNNTQNNNQEPQTRYSIIYFKGKYRVYVDGSNSIDEVIHICDLKSRDEIRGYGMEYTNIVFEDTQNKNKIYSKSSEEMAVLIKKYLKQLRRSNSL